MINTFSPDSIYVGGHKISFQPQSEQNFGGLSWGLLRFDLKDELYLGIDSNIGKNNKAIVQLSKDGKVFTVECISDETGFCYESIHQKDIKMSGDFKIQISIDGASFSSKGKFSRKLKPTLLLKEILLSV